MRLSKQIVMFFMCICILGMIGCGGTYHYKLQKTQVTAFAKKIPGSVNFKVSAEKTYSHAVGTRLYKLYVKEAVEKQFKESLSKCFEKGIEKESPDITIMITAIDTSILPIAYIINDVRLYFRIEIFDKDMNKQKTLTIYGFGSDPDGNKALEKSLANTFHQLLPVLEELFIRQ